MMPTRRKFVDTGMEKRGPARLVDPDYRLPSVKAMRTNDPLSKVNPGSNLLPAAAGGATLLRFILAAWIAR
jgi:hypothetical protein